ncbi:MAG: plasmid pRiA4b ORF-3 family protein [Cytophagales bacterium]|nr:plasmid pRiA4b ORF-3 family protein [Cytophagales bacterium]
MGKIIKSPTSEIYHIKALIPYWDELTGGTSEKSPHRIIAIRPFMPLTELGVSVLDAFDFDNDHLFGYYDNFKQHYSSKISYEHPEMIEDSADDWGGFSSRKIDKQVFNMDDHTAMDIFTRKGKKWLMLFDYGDEWNFWLSLEKKVVIDPKMDYPEMVESKYDAPEQYPDYEDEI